MSRTGRSSAETLTVGVGAVTAVVVLLTTAAAVWAGSGDRSADPHRPAVRASATSSPSGASTAAPAATSAFADAQRVYGDGRANTVYQVPAVAEGWEVLAGGMRYFYERDDGSADVVATRLAVYGSGTCPDDGRDTVRAYIGLVSPSTTSEGTLGQANVAIRQRWLAALGRDTDGGRDAPKPRVEVADVTTPSGQPAVRARATVLTAGQKCAAPRTELVVQTTDTGDAYSTVVLVRDLDVAGELPGAEAGLILDTIDAEVPPES